MSKPKALFCWSGGKDSAFALHQCLLQQQFDVVSLLTTLNANHGRISMHGVREELVDRQAQSLRLPLEKVWVREGTNAEYEQAMEEKLVSWKARGVTHVLFGDIFLEDLRAYREKNLQRVGLLAEFPIWKRNTKDLIKEFLVEGFETITCCVNTKWLDESFAGKVIDEDFLASLPANVDPCGENGEFHSFCYKGPIFKDEIRFRTGEKLFRPLADYGVEGNEGFWFADLIPG